MGNEIWLFGETNSLKNAFLNSLLGVWVFPDAAVTAMVPIVRISVGSQTGLWLRQKGETYSLTPLDTWSDIPEDWSSFEFVEMVLPEHPQLSRGLILWNMPEFSQKNSSIGAYVLTFLSKRPRSNASNYYFLENCFGLSRLLEIQTELGTQLVFVTVGPESNPGELESVSSESPIMNDNAPVLPVRIGRIPKETLKQLDDVLKAKRLDFTEWEILRRYLTLRCSKMDSLNELAIVKDFQNNSCEIIPIEAVDHEALDDLTLQSAFQKGDAKAAYVLAKRHFSRKEIAQALKWIEVSAGEGYDVAQYEYGSLLEQGVIVEQDFEKAVRLYRKAAEQNHVNACLNLGVCYINGTGVERNYAEQFRWLKKAIDLGSERAIYNLAICNLDGVGIDQDIAQGIGLMIEAANLGEREAQFSLGSYYEDGRYVDQDIQQAIHWYQVAAENGVGGAAANLGLIYANGEATPQDLPLAFKWFRAGAEQGNPNAQSNLGLCYWNGVVVEKDEKEAVNWFTKSAEQGDRDSLCYLALAYQFGMGCAIDERKSLSLMREAARLGMELAIEYLKSEEYQDRVAQDSRKSS